jgi:hypothetical protein
MGTVKDHLPVKYFAAVAHTPGIDLEHVIKEIETIFSPVEITSPVYDYTHFTEYYNQEMGAEITKKFIVFRNVMSPGLLPKMKLAANTLEDKYKIENRRPLNIDPGYISEAKLILATTKNYSHRIYLNSGIFGDLHLMFSHKQFQAMPWTYPDYQTPEMLRFFEGVRERYLQQVKDMGML